MLYFDPRYCIAIQDIGLLRHPKYIEKPGSIDNSTFPG